jgi:competence protein ComEC
MSTIHFLNVLEGDCNIIQHDNPGRVSVIDVSNAYNDEDTDQEKAVKSSTERKTMLARTQVPAEKIDYGQKKIPDNPIEYLNRLDIREIWRFVITHPDMDHLDGVRDLYSEFSVLHTWDTNNNKVIAAKDFGGGFNYEDWQFYERLRSEKVTTTKRLALYSGDNGDFWNQDNIKVLCTTEDLLKTANKTGDHNDASYVLLYTPPKKNGGIWKILFAGDSHDGSWQHIIEKYSTEVSNIDILFAAHHGRDSGRNYDFLKTLKPKVTLFGNASSEHLAYNKYPKTRITNNQAGYIVMEISLDEIAFYVKNDEFARDFRRKKGLSEPTYNTQHDGWFLDQLNA